MGLKGDIWSMLLPSSKRSTGHPWCIPVHAQRIHGTATAHPQCHHLSPWGSNLVHRPIPTCSNTSTGALRIPPRGKAGLKSNHPQQQ